jgi:anti-sigma regulatory factor (Ser/Thr protein kinase)
VEAVSKDNLVDKIKPLRKEAAIFDHLDFALPELIIVNFQDANIDIQKIMSHIQNDKWLLSFGVIGLFEAKEKDEEELVKTYAGSNVITFLDFNQIRTHLGKTISIIKENYQIIFQRDFSVNLMESIGGSFSIENDIRAVSLYAGIAALILLQRGLMPPHSKMRLQLAIEELIVNAVEHGNCGITYDDKTEALAKGISVMELVALRCKDPKINAKRVRLEWEIGSEETLFTVTDEGNGFNVEELRKKMRAQDVFSQHGRGIMLAQSIASSLDFNDKGNQVKITVKHDSHIEHEIPEGFSYEKVVDVKPGDLIIKEDQPGDSICYIVSGKYGVYHNNKQIATLGPEDIFMGEMAFLLGKRRTASIKAITDGKVIVLTRKALVNVIKSYPQYGLFIAKLLAQRLDRRNKTL